MPHATLKHWHPMVGMDWHIPWPPGAPAPAPAPVPYRTGQILNGIVPPLFSKPFMKHQTQSFGLCLPKGTDIGTGIPHVGPPSVTLPIEIIFSASKAHFASSRYLAEGKPVACALAIMVNPNLNCGTPIPTPTGAAIALTTHFVEMTWADIFSGVFNLLCDAALQWALGKITGPVGDRMARAFRKLIGPQVFTNALLRVCRTVDLNKFPKTAYDLANFATRIALARAGFAVGQIPGFFVGGPLGMDLGTFVGYMPGEDGNTTAGGRATELLGGAADDSGQAVGGYLDDKGVPGIPDFGLTESNVI